MLTTYLHPECIDLVLSFCSPLTREILRYVPTLIPLTLLEKYEHTHGRSSSVCDDAARSGSLPLLEWAKDMKYKWCIRSLYANAAYGGNMNAIDYFWGLPKTYMENGELTIPRIVYVSAAHGGHLHIIDSYMTLPCMWYQYDKKITKEVLCTFAEKGNLEALQRYRHVVATSDTFVRDSMCEQAALYGHLHILKYMMDECFFSGTNLLVSVCINLIAGSNPSLLKSSLIASRIDAYSSANAWKIGGDKLFCSAVSRARNDNTELLDWVLANGFKCGDNESDLNNAAHCGNLEVLKRLVKLHLGNTPVGDRLVISMSNAASEGGSLNVLKYIKSTYQFVALNDVCNNAAVRGDLVMLQWAIENGYRCNESLFYQTANTRSDSLEHEMSKLNTLKWLESRPEFMCRVELKTMCTFAVEGGNMRILEYYERDGVMDPMRMCKKAVKSGQLSILKRYWNNEWCTEKDIEVARSRIFTATFNNPDVAEFLYRKNRFVSVEQRVAVLEWLKSK